MGAAAVLSYAVLAEQLAGLPLGDTGLASELGTELALDRSGPRVDEGKNGVWEAIDENHSARCRSGLR